MVYTGTALTSWSLLIYTDGLPKLAKSQYFPMKGILII